MNASASQLYTSYSAKLLPTVLSVIAGSTDITSLLGLGLFSAHVTGNLVLLVARIVAGRADNTCLILSVPVFVLALGLTRLLVASLEAFNIGSLRPLLLLQFLMLSGSFALGLASGSHPEPEARSLIAAGQFSVAAMAVQNALVQVSLDGLATAVMTTNLTRFVMDAGETFLGRDQAEVDKARRRAKHTWPVIIGFIIGACLGAACFAAAGLKSLGVPAGLSLLAIILSPPTKLTARNKR